MNLSPSLVFSVAVATVGMRIVQRLMSNRRGSEDSVAESLSQISDGVWTFVAMRYYFGILNRTFLVFVTEDQICGAKVKGLVAAPVARDERWRHPLFYVSPRLAQEYTKMKAGSEDFLKHNFANFSVNRSEVFAFEYSSKPKWGMGIVPYSGRVFLKMKSGKSLELILLGKQNGPGIARRLQGINILEFRTLPSEILTRLRIMFPEDARLAQDILEHECFESLASTDTLGVDGINRVRCAALKLSEGSIPKLRSAVELANTDWRNALMAAGFGDPTAHRLWLFDQGQLFIQA